ncbi:hypothetical protein HLB42_16255 [Deinococcus sp. D7000]|uniref:hypothetical protein n=1 Tax=Deinococcus radiopugnans TaxID=57497 RepID=UPI0006908634|nr:hypothetical protein [Deinococcus radiopugnans]QLG12158.1 hypothetical protein HLB42_16255 [Deinococcus sp. D7000]
MTAGLHQLPVKMLGDLISPRALERILQDAATSRGTTPGGMDSQTLEDILKREVFKRLQLSVPAPLAKRRVSEVLAELSRTTQERAPLNDAALDELEEHARRFALYFDWPETQRLRGLLGVARQEQEAGRDIAPLVQEGRDLTAQMDRRLQEGLVVQAQDLAELRAIFTRVQGLGSREVRRLDTLIAQIDEAQTQGTLVPGEVDRARTLTYTLRKLLESSVVQGLGGGDSAESALAQARVLELEREHALQALNAAEQEFAALLLVRPELRAQFETLRGNGAQPPPTAQALEGWCETLRTVLAEVLSEQRDELSALERDLSGHPAGAGVRVSLDAARHLLDRGSLASDELRALGTARGALQASPDGAGLSGEAGLNAGRELLEIERTARDLPGAAAELAPLIAEAQAALSHGQEANLDPLWAVLERHMGAAAQERESFDDRADRIVAEYDAVRGLAGETTQRLGRLADTLRAQRRLGPMSAAARSRYAQTLDDAETLLAEAQAEYRAAQEVAATFGDDALSGLLGVFELGALGQEPSVPADPNEAEVWTLQGCMLLSGPRDEITVPLTNLITLAEDMGVTDLTMDSAGHRWAAQRDAEGLWQVTRTRR